MRVSLELPLNLLLYFRLNSSWVYATSAVVVCNSRAIRGALVVQPLRLFSLSLVGTGIQLLCVWLQTRFLVGLWNRYGRWDRSRAAWLVLSQLVHQLHVPHPLLLRSRVLGLTFQFHLHLLHDQWRSNPVLQATLRNPRSLKSLDLHIGTSQKHRKRPKLVPFLLRRVLGNVIGILQELRQNDITGPETIEKDEFVGDNPAVDTEEDGNAQSCTVLWHCLASKTTSTLLGSTQYLPRASPLGTKQVSNGGSDRRRGIWAGRSRALECSDPQTWNDFGSLSGKDSHGLFRRSLGRVSGYECRNGYYNTDSNHVCRSKELGMRGCRCYKRFIEQVQSASRVSALVRWDSLPVDRRVCRACHKVQAMDSRSIHTSLTAAGMRQLNKWLADLEGHDRGDGDDDWDKVEGIPSGKERKDKPGGKNESFPPEPPGLQSTGGGKPGSKKETELKKREELRARLAKARSRMENGWDSGQNKGAGTAVRPVPDDQATFVDSSPEPTPSVLDDLALREQDRKRLRHRDRRNQLALAPSEVHVPGPPKVKKEKKEKSKRKSKPSPSREPPEVTKGGTMSALQTQLVLQAAATGRERLAERQKKEKNKESSDPKKALTRILTSLVKDGKDKKKKKKKKKNPRTKAILHLPIHRGAMGVRGRVPTARTRTMACWKRSRRAPNWKRRFGKRRENVQGRFCRS